MAIIWRSSGFPFARSRTVYGAWGLRSHAISTVSTANGSFSTGKPSRRHPAISLGRMGERHGLGDIEAAGELHLHGVVKSHRERDQFMIEYQGQVPCKWVRGRRNEDQAEPALRR